MGLNKQTKKSTRFSYPNLKSAIRPATHSDDIPITVFTESQLSDIQPSEHHEEKSDSSDMNQDVNFLVNSN